MSDSAENNPDGNLSEDFEDLYQNAPCGYMSLRPGGRIVRANATLSTWTGYAPEELVGKRLIDLLNIAGRMFYETHFAPLLRMQGFFHEVALDFIRKNGTKIPVLANAVEKRNTAGDLLFTRLTIFQATERRRYERELVDARRVAETAKRQLQELNATLEDRIRIAVAERLQVEEGLRAEKAIAELREQFIAVLGHDLRNPLASIAGGARILQGEPLSGKANRVVALMQGSTTRMSGLIDNLLDFARGRLGGGFVLDRNADQPLQTVLEQVAAELQVGSPDHIIETEFNLIEPIDCDRSRIGQMVSNLLGNALTHGSVDEPVRLKAFSRDGVLEIAVENAGKPIPEKAMENLFQPFFRGEVRASQQGLGLGLFIASEIAKAHGGTLSVDSSKSSTCFTFRMPLTKI